MKKYLISFANKIGMDKAIAYSSSSRIIAGVAGVLSVFFISTFLTGVEQGFYFTFGSIVSMQIFFELGLTSIMTQFVAHEAAHLRINEASQYEGDEYYKSRLSSLVVFCMKWYAVLAIIVFVFLMIVGNVYFKKYGSDESGVAWELPWLLVCLGTAVKLFQSPFSSILSGLGKVKEMSKISFWQQLLLPLASWTGLILGFKLYVIGISYLLTVFIWQFFVYKMGLYKVLWNLFRNEISSRVSYIKEIFPLQWRISLSWVSGYFIAQFYNPVLFATDGAVVAGQMGMTLSALAAIQSLALSWLNTKVPRYSSLIAQQDYTTLDSLFNKTLRQMVSVCAFLLISFFAFIAFLNITQFKLGESVLADRFLGYIPLLLMSIPVFTQQFVNSWATYLRCHKREPFLVYSVVGGVACIVSTLLFGNLYGLYGVTIGYFVIQTSMVPWAYYIFRTKKAEWHE